jgi:hypothetical protein
MINDAKLDFWIKNNYNCLLVGKHGVGKTAQVIEAFNRNKLKWMYFSASTMDPWVDFIGVPREQKDEKGNSYLDLVRPKMFQNDEVEALFFDEYNRSAIKIRNAVMELIQFKSINGKKFHNLRIVWAAINPDSEEGDDDQQYDVERLDPAQKDRFHIIIDIPYKPSSEFFKSKYGDKGIIAIDWWHELNTKVRNLVSPRRLDYALDIYNNGGDLRDALPNACNISKLIQELSNGSFVKALQNICKEKDDTKAKDFINIENNFTNTINYILKNDDLIKYFIPMISKEKLSSIINEPKIRTFCYKHVDKYYDFLKELLEAKSISPKLSKEITVTLGRYAYTKAAKEQPKNNIAANSLQDQLPKKLNNSLSKTNFWNYMYSLSSISRGSTYRYDTIKDIQKFMPLDLDEPNAVKLLDIINTILNSTNSSTLINHQNIFEKLPKYINFCLKVVYDTKKDPAFINELLRKYKTNSPYHTDRVSEYYKNNGINNFFNEYRKTIPGYVNIGNKQLDISKNKLLINSLD